MAEPGIHASITAEYSQGYSTDVDTIREKEYPLLNGMDLNSPIPFHSKIVMDFTDSIP